MVKLTAALVEGFSGMFLSPMYDQPAKTPPFHRTGWELYCSDQELAGVVAPRGHAKSTAFTHDFILANVLFQVESYVIIVSATEDLAKDHLGDIARVLREDDDVRAEFGITDLVVDAKTEIVVKFANGWEARLLAKGAGQKMRGLKWKGRRPGLIVCDDLEEDEQVESKERRQKFGKWFFRALLPCRRKGGKVRYHGTILHEDALLARLQKSSVWKFNFHKAHSGLDDFSEILWPEMFDVQRLKEIRQGYLDDNDPSGYAQEYLNDPSDSDDAYLAPEWFLAMSDEDYESNKIICAAADWAISKKDKANRTSLTIGGKDLSNVVNIIDQRVGRWDSLEILEEVFDVQRMWNPAVFWVESGQIWLSLAPMFRKEMLSRDCFINFVERQPIGDKAARGRPLQRRMRAGGVHFADIAHWYPGYKDELLRFKEGSEAKLDDQFDSTALLVAGFETLNDADLDDFASDEEHEMQRSDPRASAGRDPITGY
jgi:hypothetical protein